MAEIILISGGPLQKEYQQINGAWKNSVTKMRCHRYPIETCRKKISFRKMPWTVPIIVLLSPLALADQSGHVHNVRKIVFLSKSTVVSNQLDDVLSTE